MYRFLVAWLVLSLSAIAPPRVDAGTAKAADSGMERRIRVAPDRTTFALFALLNAAGMTLKIRRRCTKFEPRFAGRWRRSFPRRTMQGCVRMPRRTPSIRGLTQSWR